MKAVTISLTVAELRRAQGAVQCAGAPGATVELFARNLLLAAVRSIEDSERGKTA